jgi:MFS family permease
MLAMAGLAVFMSGPAQTYGVSAFVDPMLTELGESRSLFSTTYSIGTLVSALTLLVVGRQIDRFGSRLVMTLAAEAVDLATDNQQRKRADQRADGVGRGEERA